MNIEAPIFAVKLAIGAERLKEDRWVNALRWKDKDDKTIELDLHELDDTELEKFHTAIKSKEGFTGMANKVAAYRNILNDKSGKTPIKKVNLLEPALIQFIIRLPNKWLFKEMEDGRFCPVYVKDVSYTPSDARSGVEAHTTLHYAHVLRDERIEGSVHWDTADMKHGRTVAELLTEEGFVAETPELHAVYNKEMERYVAINHSTGVQFNATGTAWVLGEWGQRAWVEMVRDGEPTKAIMDDDDAEAWESSSRSEKSTTISGGFWDSKIARRKTKDDDDESTVVLPAHPYVKVFDIKNHNFLKIHVMFLADYVYDKKLIEKLVLPDHQKDLVTILIESTNTQLEDIVKGKTGGVIVIATGPPGVGKTLTAEVCSETVERPLYPVQCSQLGTDEETVEKKLQIVLRRAARWKAILLIDEADVYIHERGENIQQNAIVGVWLRLMEYYRGIMFMTSNRAVIIDDAILSRATAWIRYVNPDKADLQKLWTILSNQYGVKLDESNINRLIEKFPTISGRSVKNMLKLSRLLSLAKKQPVTVDRIEYCAQFLDVETGEVKK